MLSNLVPTATCSLALCFHLLIEMKTQRGFIYLRHVIKLVRDEAKIQTEFCWTPELSAFPYTLF